MKRLFTPYNARQILEVRLNGKRPSQMLLVSTVGWLGELNPCVLARLDRSYDWRFLADLSVLLVAESTANKEAVREMIRDILAVKPAYLGLWMTDRQDGINIAWGPYQPKSNAIRRMSHFERKQLAGIDKKPISLTQE